jgi:hypothetical protein
MSTLSPLAVPETPKKKAVVDKLIETLNTEYNLAIKVPDLGLSPHHRKQVIQTLDEQRAEKIHVRLRFLYYQHQDVLDDALEQFRARATELCKKWDSDTLPRSVAPPQTKSAAETHELQDCLLLILNECFDGLNVPTFNTRSFQRPVQADAAGSGSTKRSGSKRPSSEFPDTPSKRAKGPNDISAAIENMPVPPKATAISFSAAAARTSASTAISSAAVSASRSYVQSEYSSTSANTSKASFPSAVFSIPEENEPPPNTQTTVASERLDKVQPIDEAFYRPSPTHARLSPNLPRSWSQYAPPSDEEIALRKLFSRPIGAESIDTEPKTDQPTSNGGEATYSSVPDIRDISMVDAGPRPESLVTLDDRLLNIWRMLSAISPSATFVSNIILSHTS